MMGFTDELIGLDFAHRRELARISADAQALVDSLDGDVNRLRAKLKSALIELEMERAVRMESQFKLDKVNKILDAPLSRH